MSEPSCEVTCVECGDDLGTHHFCTDCLQAVVPDPNNPGGSDA
jgi:hypothetical protein